MTRRDDDYIGHVPKMTPAHDEIASYQKTRARGSLAASIGEVPDVGPSTSNRAGKSSNGMAVVFAILIALAVAAWAAYLQQQLGAATAELNAYQLRIANLEERLSVTDESVGESSAAMKVKVREMDIEIRKLWDNVWKKTKDRMDVYDRKITEYDKSIAAMNKFVSGSGQQRAQQDKSSTQLSAQVKQLQQAVNTVKTNQQNLAKQGGSVESMTDKLNSLNIELAQLDRRLQDSEEWVEAINGFRRQVNNDLGLLRQDVNRLKGGG